MCTKCDKKPLKRTLKHDLNTVWLLSEDQRYDTWITYRVVLYDFWCKHTIATLWAKWRRECINIYNVEHEGYLFTFGPTIPFDARNLVIDLLTHKRKSPSPCIDVQSLWSMKLGKVSPPSHYWECVYWWRRGVFSSLYCGFCVRNISKHCSRLNQLTWLQTQFRSTFLHRKNLTTKFGQIWVLLQSPMFHVLKVEHN